MNKKGNWKLSTLLIAIATVSLFAVLFTLMIGDMSSKYGTSFDNDTFADFNKMQDLSNQTKNIKERATTIKEQTGILDRVGALFSSAYQTILLSLGSLDTMTSIIGKGVSMIPFGEAGPFIEAYGVQLIIIIFVVGILLSILFKWWT